MIHSINPYASAKTAEIMSRYRPIAPKPENPNPNPESESSAAVPTGIRNSPYLRRVWENLQARPTRTRKRGRTASFTPPSLKRARGYPPPVHVPGSFIPISCCLDAAVANLTETVSRGGARGKGKGIDLNAAAALEEVDLLPVFGGRVICPRPVRPVGSRIFVEKFVGGGLGWPTVAAKGVEEVEEMVEAERVPVVVTDSRNKVRMCNAAYKEMVGQPECGWLDCVGGGAWRRIGGQISVLFSDAVVEMGMHGFSCGAKIEWENKGVKKSVKAYCEGMKLQLKLGSQANKDYQFMWRFNAIN